MTNKRKDLKVNSPQWIAAWKVILSEGFIMRCLLEPSNHTIRFWMEAFLKDDATGICQIRFERFFGDTIAAPRALAATYDAPLQAFLDDLDNFAIGNGACLVNTELALPVPHRAFISPFGSTEVFLLPTNHPVLMASYGAVREWAYHAKRGLVKSDNTLAEEKLEGKVITYDSHQRKLWDVFERRFNIFLYRQQRSLINNTVGEVAQAHV